MADPDGAVVVHGTVAVNGRVVSRDPNAIVAEIERTRESLAQTIDAIAERVNPATNVRLLRERAQQELARPEVQLAALAVGLATAGILIYRIWGRRAR